MPTSQTRTLGSPTRKRLMAASQESLHLPGLFSDGEEGVGGLCANVKLNLELQAGEGGVSCLH